MKSTRPDSAARTAGVELFDVCHVGVVLRAALFVHAALAVGVLFQVQTLRGFALQFSLATAIALPAVLAWLIATCLLKNLIAGIAAPAQAAISATLGALCALGGRELVMQANPAGLEQLTLLATAAAGAALALVMHQWLRMQALARTPADTAAQLAELQSRIRPHFLFNTLNSALALVRHDPQRAEQYGQLLSSVHRPDPVNRSPTEPQRLRQKYWFL
jgi:two-component system sensor histidine kinase AlgZ